MLKNIIIVSLISVMNIFYAIGIFNYIPIGNNVLGYSSIELSRLTPYIILLILMVAGESALFISRKASIKKTAMAMFTTYWSMSFLIRFM